MHPILYSRSAAVVAALIAATFVSLPSLSGAGLFAVNPSVDRTLKGDRLPAAAPGASARKAGAPDPAKRQSHEKVPLGCDAAFSPISSPALAHVFRRCAV